MPILSESERRKITERLVRCLSLAERPGTLEQSHPSWNRDGGFRNGPEM